MNSKWYDYVRYSLVSLILAMIAGTLAMIGVYCIPTEPIRQHVQESLYIYSTEGDYYSWASERANTMLDNYTDALMLNEASFVGTGSVVDDAMNNPYVYYRETSRVQSLMLSFSSNDIDENDIGTYARYWHGALIFLKPLLYFLTVPDIRVLNMMVQMLLMIMLLVEAYKAEGNRLVLPLTLSILCLNPVSTALCMQYADIYMITLLGSIVMLRRWCKGSCNNIWRIFLWIGIATAYLDFLTYPLVGLGYILIIYLYLCRHDRLIIRMKRTIGCSISWGCGYACMWLGKWVIATILTGENVLFGGFAAAVQRTAGDAASGSDTEYSSIWAVISRNVCSLFTIPYIVFAVLCILIFVMIALFGHVRICVVWRRLIPYVIVGCYPFLWYGILRNHSWIHSWMTQRELAITVLAFCIILADSWQVVEIKQ